MSARTTSALVGVLLLAAACGRAALADPPRAWVNPHRETARHVLEVHCGMCHRSDSPAANPRALAVYTLNDLDWAACMTDHQVADLRIHVEDNPVDVPAAARKAVVAFVEVELAHRQHPARQPESRTK